MRNGVPHLSTLKPADNLIRVSRRDSNEVLHIGMSQRTHCGCYELEITTVLTVRNRGRDETILLCSSPGNYVNKIRADSWGYAFGTFPRLQISAASESGLSKRLNRGINSRTCFKMSRGSASRAEEISITAVSEGVFMRLSKWPIYFSL
jgi:hypothetical protein